MHIVPIPHKSVDRLWSEFRRSVGAFKYDPCEETYTQAHDAHRRYVEAYKLEVSPEEVGHERCAL
jgi:hypothetical protein